MKDAKVLYTRLVWLFISIALIGVAILFYESLVGQTNTILFSLVVFVISIAALVMTTLQSLSIQRQMKMTENMLRKTNRSSHEMEQLIKEDRKLEREIRKDIALDQEIIAVLEEHGVGASQDERRQVATKIARLSRR